MMDLTAKHEGEPLKNLALSFGGVTVRGELMLTRVRHRGRRGLCLERGFARCDRAGQRGGADAGSSPAAIPLEQVRERLRRPRGSESFSNRLRKALNLTGPLPSLVRGVAGSSTEPGRVAPLIKALPLRLTGCRPIERAISTAGGIDLDEVTPDLMLKRLPGVFVAGEMLDWEASDRRVPASGRLRQRSCRRAWGGGTAWKTGLMWRR